MKAIYGLYSDPDSAQHAVDELRKAGVADRSITVVTSQPYEEYEFSHRYRPTWIFWIAAGGGLVGLGIGFTLAYLTQTLWPIVTGGMPIVAWWPNIIIMFELTMLGAVFATVLTLLIAARLPSKLSRLYDPAISNGRILIGVERPQDSELDRIERALKAADAEKLGRIV